MHCQGSTCGDNGLWDQLITCWAVIRMVPHDGIQYWTPREMQLAIADLGERWGCGVDSG